MRKSADVNRLQLRVSYYGGGGNGGVGAGDLNVIIQQKSVAAKITLANALTTQHGNRRPPLSDRRYVF